MKIVLLDHKESGRCSMSNKDGGEVVLVQTREGVAATWLSLKSLAQVIRLEAAAENGSIDAGPQHGARSEK